MITARNLISLRVPLCALQLLDNAYRGPEQALLLSWARLIRTATAQVCVCVRGVGAIV